MSGITSVVEPVFSGIGDAVSGVASTIGNAVVSNAGTIGKSILSDEQLSQQQSAKEQQTAANNAARAAELTDNANQQMFLRNQNLAKGLSHAKAFFAAQGIDPNSGSTNTYASAQSGDTAELNDYTQNQLSNNINDLNRSLADLQSNDLLARTQKEQSQLFNSFLS